MAISVRSKWSGDAFLRAMEKHIDNNVERAALVLVGDIVTNFPGGEGGAAGRDKSGRFKKALRKASLAGEIPAVQTGALKGSITNARVKPQFQHVGSTLRAEPGQTASYPLMLELGTKNMDPHRWLRPGLKRARGKMNRELQRKSKA